MPRTLLFTVPRTDLEIQTFRSGGPGGQHQNKRDTGVRILHHPSGARGESRTHRSQHANKRAALIRLVYSHTFQTWARQEAARQQLARDTLDQRVHQLMQPWNLKVEVLGPNNQWTEERKPR